MESAGTTAARRAVIPGRWNKIDGRAGIDVLWAACRMRRNPIGGTVERFRVVVLPHLDAAYGFARWLTRDPVAGAGPGAGSDAARAALLPRLPRRGGAALAAAHRAQHLDRPQQAQRGADQPAGGGREPGRRTGPIPSRARWPAIGGARSRRRWRRCRPRRARSSCCARSRTFRTSRSRRCSTCRSAPSCRALARAREKLAAELRGRLGRRDHGLPDL